MTKRIQTSIRKRHIKELLENDQSYNIYKDKKVISWNISDRQIQRYLQSIKKSNNELNKLLSIPGKDLHKGTYRIPYPLKDKLKEYCNKNADLKQQNIVIIALYEYLDKHK